MTPTEASQARGGSLGGLPCLPTTVVGSYSVPEWLQRLKTEYYQRRISAAHLAEICEVAIKAAVKDQELAGIDIVSDGELRRDNDIDYFLARIPGVHIPQRAKADYYDYYDAEATAPLPEDDKASLGLAADYAFTRALTDRAVKFSFTGPFSLSRRVVNRGAYDDPADLVRALARRLHGEAQSLATAGATFLQIDEPFLAGYPEQAALAVEAVNIVTDGVPVSWALHVCYGNRYARPSWEGHYDFLFPAAASARVDQLVLEFARKGLEDLRLIREYSWDRSVGLGVIDVKSAAVESPELVAARIRRALEYVPPGRLMINPDCGLRHLAPDVARRKLRAMVAGADIVRGELTLPAVPAWGDSCSPEPPAAAPRAGAEPRSAPAPSAPVAASSGAAGVTVEQNSYRLNESFWERKQAPVAQETSMSSGFLFTSESVTEGHPDKIADQISDAVVDAALAGDPLSRVACETLLTTGTIIVAGEITSTATIDYQSLARSVVNEIGYDNGEYYFDGNAVGVHVIIDKQSPDIAQGVDTAHDSRVRGSEDPLDKIGAGDQGMMFGYATNETPEYMPAPITWAHQLSTKLSEVRHSGVLPYLRPDGKTQVTVRYDDKGRPVGIEKVLISTQHQDGVESKLPDALWTEVVLPVLPDGMYDPDKLRAEFYCNPTGRFVIGGPVGDTGLTGRKIIVDTYGGFARHGGGAFSGKDPSKVDRSAAYAARYVAKNIVAAGLADRAEVQVAYAIGVARPLSLLVETFGTEKISRGRIAELVGEHFDLRPGAIVRDLDLRRPIYRQTAAYGHFGRTSADGFTWERTDKAAALQAAAGL